MENAQAADGPALSLQALLHLSSLTVADEGTPEKPAKVVKDSAQEQANNVFQRIMLNNIPDKPRQALFPGLAPLTPEEKAVSDKNAAFYKEGSIAYVSQYLASAQEVDADTKSHINNDRVKLFWDAVGSFGAPDPNKDPVKQYGWDRNSEAFKNIQGAFVNQNLDTYKIGYKQGVPAFRPYLDDPKKWHDELAAYLSDGKFLARWAYRNSVPGYTDGHRQVYEWQTQLSILQREAEARGLTVQRQTQDVANSLTTAILLPKFDEVNWTDDMKQQYELQVKSIMAYSDKELEEIKKRNAEEYARIMAIKVGVQVHGTVDHFVMAADQALRGIEKIYLDKWNKSLTAGDLLQIQEKYRDAFIVAGENVQSEQFIQIVGEGYVKEVAESLSPHASKWKTWAAKAKEWGSSIKAAAKPLLYAAGVGVVIYALCGGVMPLTPVEIVSLTGIAIALSIQTLSSFAVTQLGAWVSKKILNPTAVGTILGQWFTQKGVSVVDKSSKLAKIFTPSSAEFLVKRLGPLMALVAVGTSIYNLVQAINHGTTSDIVYNSIFLGLAIIETAVVAIGLFASHTAIAAFCGPIGIAVAAIGFIVAIISLFVHDKPVAPNPAKDFVNGVCKDAGFFK
ncbi:hypothetical protein GLOTRDRAFT_117818 [Gloeophyllum trabeum ATCC 11539]|uniref:Uncharacterized protein n=1 Tax=Gloeophyllum trabeum (strain ATCC 11539 / FP-39264 / Madison 617) TaxID=670483 RepID=S7PWH2_GLOTA|nr:uncharacterized protein GLOTRDRAFT_117818 [Gloeophyllum trabeum ATCC 11539]EPQ51873.1 hypothetical protein GLOTRDRAFT_117818 [Gloeophyllum trabeum ATCC 11539]